ncbi:MAG: ribose 5-phosphate isomerase B [Candidatus Hydrogenedentes bacterium]|nr:ribose 5-phosphate isomerase B [Candidatus Hydrogenedentota bacterium]
MKIAFGCDHAGFEAPEPFYAPEIVRYMESLGHEVANCGTHGPDSVDYPDFANAVSAKVLSGECVYGVLLCGTGMGISIAANRHKGIRAAACVTPEMVSLARDHNNANVLCLGRRISSLKECLRLVEIFFSTPFSNGERHVRRIQKMG